MPVIRTRRDSTPFAGDLSKGLFFVVTSRFQEMRVYGANLLTTTTRAGCSGCRRPVTTSVINADVLTPSERRRRK